ncbi:sugar phosphate isomerase/epimerase family protein [Cyclobacterium jeungdonense]|uniref:Sugar phosphate isomerase/epimerase family protein n=1 Tax=Cyclobacterium jeungdonense TaxID=708087 RepID=A0ABT8C2L1_9BACT|nr:sugar phosphate isomerase/epimerase family protein [Cyclobacterium jeungdonense]MDN3687019.1 sugar phosphate isomerase/epimerase family protein [Cyclobacterium jeungdonense]
MDRRTFIQQSSLLSLGLASAPYLSHAGGNIQERKFRVSLNPYAIGVSINQEEMIDKAVAYNFEAILPVPAQLMEMSPGKFDEFLAKKEAHNLTWDAAGLPVDFRKDKATFEEGIKDLPKVATILRKAGVSRVGTWIMPSHDELPYLDNFKQHSERLGKAAQLLGDEGLKLGFEYVGTKNLKIINRYPFVGTLKEVQDLIAEIGHPNLGVQLDSFHWYTSSESVADLEKLTNEQIVTCDLNDATAGRTIPEQIDGERQLPGDSGLIDLKGFMQALVTIGYDGPVRAEPFNAKLNAMDNEQALAATSKAMWRTVNLI